MYRDEDLAPFEGLVFSTARMFASQVKREEDDLAQELRIVVWRAVRKHDPTRSSLSLERYVFGCLTNKIRDYKRDAAREHDRRERFGVGFLHIEDMRLISTDSDLGGDRQEAFDSRYNFMAREEVYGRIEDGLFELPSTVTEQEADVLVMLMMDLTKPEIMLRLSLTRARVDACVDALREKFADWKPAASEAAREASESLERDLQSAREAAAA